MGLFQPAWMSKNETRAIRAVQKISDDAELWTILRDTKSPAVGLAALAQVPDANLGRIAAVAEHGGTKEVAVAAYRRLLTLDARRIRFADIAIHSRYVSEIAITAVGELKDQKTLFDVASETTNMEVWSAAALRLKDAAKRARLIMQPTTMEKLYNDEPLLKPLGKATREKRLSLLKATTDAEALMTVAVQSRDEEFAQCALEAIGETEKQSLMMVAMRAEIRAVAEAALSKLGHDDRNRLGCCTDSRSRWESVRMAAATQLLVSSSAAMLAKTMADIASGQDIRLKDAAYTLIIRGDQNVAKAYLKLLAKGVEGNLSTYYALKTSGDEKLSDAVLLGGTEKSVKDVLAYGAPSSKALKKLVEDKGKPCRASALQELVNYRSITADALAGCLGDEELCHVAARQLAQLGDIRGLNQSIIDKDITALSNYPCRESVDTLLGIIRSETPYKAADAEYAIKKLYAAGMADYVRSKPLSEYKRPHTDMGKDSCHTDEPGVSFDFVTEAKK